MVGRRLRTRLASPHLIPSFEAGVKKRRVRTAHGPFDYSVGALLDIEYPAGVCTIS